MPESFQYDVFLSHSSKDKDVVRPLAERLRKDGLRVWFDDFVLKPGDNLPKKIDDGLEESRVLVLCMSANAFGSDWATLESQTFRFRDPLNEDRRFIPMRLDVSPTQLSLAQFLPLKWQLVNQEQEYLRLFDACRLPRKIPAVQQPAVRAGFKAADLNLESQRNSSLAACVFNPDGTRVLTGSHDSTIRVWDTETGRCLSKLKSEGGIRDLIWSADQHYAMSASGDGNVRLWDIAKGRCLRVFEGHTGSVWSVAWSDDRRLALSGSQDQTVRVWDLKTGLCQRVIKVNSGPIKSLAWSTDHHRAVFGAWPWNGVGVQLWDIDSGTSLHGFEGHPAVVNCVEWSADQHRLLSAASDSTVRLWDVELKSCLRLLEGHTKEVMTVEWSADGRHALSGSSDKTVRLWDVETGRCLRVLEGHTSEVISVAWSINHHYAFSGGVSGDIRVWDLSSILMESQMAEANILNLQLTPPQVQYANAKVLLVGDTGVGKSGLAERLVHKQFVPTKSSHSRQAHVLDSTVVKEPNGVSLRREAILWDLAGQPAYRLVHQLSMEDAALACVLFDARSETNPFEGAAYWSQVLDQARTNTKIKKLLVASRIDVGGLPASPERIESFARENGFEYFIPTSANTGQGCEELLKAIHEGIPWNEIPKVTTTRILASAREYFAKLKGEEDKGVSADGEAAPLTRLFTIAALHEGFSAFFGEKIPLEEFIAHLQRLEASDTVDLLVFSTTGALPRAQDLVLLDPTRVDAYSSAILVAAKDEPDGPGHLLEARIREGNFTLDKKERLADSDSERHLLVFVIEKLLSRDLALREQIKGKDYLVFPSQCTAELRFPGAGSFGMVFSFAGPVRSIYARLIAHLAHYEGFKKREFFQDAAAYRAEAGGRCVIRLRDHGRGQGELEVLYDTETPASVRQGFLEFVSKQLEANSTPESVARRLAYHCANRKCANPFEDRVVKARLAAGKKNLICPICEEKTPLVDLLAPPSAAAESIAVQIDIDAQAGRQRMTAAFVIKTKEAEGKFDVFLSHNSKDKAAVEKIAKQLKAVGLRPWLDKWNLAGGDTLMDALEQAIKTIPCAALCFGPADVGRWHIMEIRSYVAAWANKSARMIPVILPGVEKPPDLPLFVQQTLWVDLRDWDKEQSDGFYQLVCAVLGRPPGDSPMKKISVRDVAKWQRMKFK